MHQTSDQCRPARCQHESRGQGRHWSGVRRSTAAPATPARRLLRSESRRSSSPRHSSWSLSFSAEIFSAAWRAPMSSNMERVAAMPDASLYVNRDGRRADDCVDSHGGGNLTKIPRSGGDSQKYVWRPPSSRNKWSSRERGCREFFWGYSHFVGWYWGSGQDAHAFPQGSDGSGFLAWHHDRRRQL